MQDLETIHLSNDQASFREAIDKHRKAGRTVVAERAGLHIVGIETFSGLDAREQALDKLAGLNRPSDSTSGEVFWPLAAGDTTAKLVDDTTPCSTN